ncbi:VWA domain-containing protein [Promethearchaeum syntrophicum]|uniref:VWA domain-containing protein n=1 Tax=Promethearchaeum syntrophicum TaxID=2594042 RepID=A0A5B9DET5_9ARCH
MKSTPLFLKNKLNTIKLSDQRILKNIAQRVSDSPQCVVKNGIPRTDGVNIFLPFSDKSLTFEDLEGLAAHEGSHIRFKSINDPQIPKELFPKNPRFAQIILNICEDARVELLLKETFPGFWDEIDILNLRLLSQKIKKIAQFPIEKKFEPEAIELLINFLSFEGCQHSELLFDLLLSEGGKFKFESSQLGLFWREISNSLKFIRSHQTFAATLIATKRIIHSILKYFDSKDDFFPKLEDRKKKEETCSKKEASSKNEASSKEEGDKSQIKGFKESRLPKEKELEKASKKDELIKEIQTTISKKFKSQIKFSSSGIQSIRLNKKSQEILKKIRGSLKSKKLDSAVDFQEFIEDNSEELNISKEEILSILQEMKEKKSCKSKFREISPEIRNFDDIISIEFFRNEKAIQNLNNVRNPAEIYKKIVNTHSILIQKLKIKFSPIKKSTNMRRGQRRGYVCGRDLAQVKISRGQFKSPFKYHNFDKGAQLVLLVDESGSMNGMRIKIARESCIILAESLKNTRISYAIIGFGAKYSKNSICEKIYKDINEQLNPSKVGSISVASAFNENRDGTSFRTVVKNHFQSQSSTNSTPILIIISDGQPHHGGTSYLGPKAIEDTRKAIFSIQRMGVKLYAISIDSSQSSYLSKIYKPNQYVILKSLSDLSSKLMHLITEIANALSH